MSLKTMPNSPSISRAYPEAGASVDCGNGPPHPDRVSAARVSQRRDRYSDTASMVLELVGKKHRTVAPWHGGVNATTATGRARRGASCFALSLSPILRRPHDETLAVVRPRPIVARISQQGETVMPPAKKRRKKKAEQESRGLTAKQVGGGEPPAEIQKVIATIGDDGGTVIGAYRDPLGGNWQVMAALPLAMVEPTPYQRDLSETYAATHAKEIVALDRLLDTSIDVSSPHAQY